MEPLDLEFWIARIKSRDALTYEDAYEGERPAGPGVVARLIRELHAAPDGYTRGKFAELLGEMGDSTVVPELVAELAHPDPDFRAWVLFALNALGGPEALAAVERHRQTHPKDI